MSEGWLDKNITKLKNGQAWVSLSPVGLEDKAPWTSRMLNFGGFTDSPHPHKQETRGLDTIQATSFFPWWLLLFFRCDRGVTGVWQGCGRGATGVWFYKSKKSKKMGSRPEFPFDLEDKAPWTSRMLNSGGFTDSPHPHKLEVMTQCRLLLSFLGGYFSSFKKTGVWQGCERGVIWQK